MLRRKITAAQFEKLSDDFKKEYHKVGDDYELDLEGYEDPAELRRAKDREAQARKDAEKTARELQKKLDELDDSDARKRGDIETLEKSYQAKYDKDTGELKEQLSARDTRIKSMMIDNKAFEVANRISTAPNVMLPHIKSRLDVDLGGDAPKLIIKDEDGAASAMKIEDLEKEFVANKDFSSIIRSSKSSGGGADTHSSKRPGGANANNDDTDKPAAKLSAHDLAARLTARKEAEQDA